MLEYTRYQSKLDSRTELENLLDDVSDDMRGLYLTLATLSESPVPIEQSISSAWLLPQSK